MKTQNKNEIVLIPIERVVSKIFLIRDKKVMIDKDGCVIWTYNPEQIRKLLSSGVKLR